MNDMNGELYRLLRIVANNHLSIPIPMALLKHVLRDVYIHDTEPRKSYSIAFPVKNPMPLSMSFRLLGYQDDSRDRHANPP